MPYNPRVTHRYGQYAAQGYEQAGDFMAQGTLGAARATAAGITARGEGIASGISSAGSSIASGIEKAGDVYWGMKAKMDQATGEIEGMRGAGLITPEEMDAYAKVRNPDKLHGMLAVKREQIQQDMITQRQEQARMSQYAYDRIAKEQAEKERETRLKNPIVVADPLDPKNKQTYIDTGAQYIPMKAPDVDKPAGSITKHPLPNGESYYTDENGKIVPASSINKGTGYEEMSPNQPKIDELTRKKSELEGKIASGDLYPGEGKLSEKLYGAFGAKPYKERLAGIDAELKALSPGSAGVTGGGQIAAGGDYKSVEDVIAAKKSGKLTREEAIKILQTKFGLE